MAYVASQYQKAGNELQVRMYMPAIDRSLSDIQTFMHFVFKVMQ